MDKIKCGLDERAWRLRWLATRDDADLRAWLYHWKLVMVTRAIPEDEIGQTAPTLVQIPETNPTPAVPDQTTTDGGESDSDSTAAPE